MAREEIDDRREEAARRKFYIGGRWVDEKRAVVGAR
jgi:hypothetical protein